MPDVVLDAFRRHRIEQKRHQLEVGEIWSNPEALVFTSPTGHPIDPMVCRKDFTKLVSSIGLSDWTPNELRHSAASLMSDAGMPIEQVADQLDNGLRTLQKHYRHRIRPTVSGGTVLDTALRS